ncbi:hypothetical protein F53441_3365 [Fusarium austroafricanum]|uniref:VWFA domain-containing protein n=1 Tax=Fusarium austroafricanum TaxID=2364996 RepID=A0A8H4P019_9HYPO|nr:hypothetical protein F53441_3365 [Fusarium austroafricanum]
MSDSTPQVVVGCLLDVSGSMRSALEPGHSNEPASDRLRAVLRVALKLAKAERQQNPNAYMFVGVFGLQTSEEHPNPSAADLCGIADTLNDSESHSSGHDLLITRANEHNLSYISKYIRSKLTCQEARIVDAHLRRHPHKVREFVDAIPPEAEADMLQRSSQSVGKTVAKAVGGFLLGPIGSALGELVGNFSGRASGSAIEDFKADNSEALAMARRIQKEWLVDFTDFVPRRVSEVVDILQRLQAHQDHHGGSGEDDDNLFDAIRAYMYGLTPMCHALEKALGAFRSKQEAQRRVLVLISDGNSTDGDPSTAASDLRSKGISIATVNLTDDRSSTQRALHYKADLLWDEGTRNLFQMSTPVPGSTHPIPVLASVGWTIPSAGEIALFATVCTVTALEEFCSMLLSARFGSADALLDIVGRIHFDDYINNEHLAIRKIKDGQPTREVLTDACNWYRPLQFQAVDEEGARQAVLRRRPVLATFGLSKPGWKEFSKHFKKNSKMRDTVLKEAQMASHYNYECDGGHAVVLVSCSPSSLTFLNSWGSSWGNNGTFAIESPAVLGNKSVSLSFYDVYWVESDLTEAERQAYDTNVDEEIRRRAEEHEGIFELEYRCPGCGDTSRLADFRGSVRRAVCPKCQQCFEPDAGNLVKALYLRAGLNDVVG